MTSCVSSGEEKQFNIADEKKTGISFINKIEPYGKTNIFDYLYYFNGGGVATGDFNNDGLEDIYFVSNEGSNKLYLNKGGLTFEDITGKAGVSGKGNWKTGVTLADVNNDGLLDIYVSEVGGHQTFRGKNELFINNGDLTFKEEAKRYGLDAEGSNTQAVFFDYDHDGDLDMFLVNHSIHSNATLQDSTIRHHHDARAGDKLFRNDLKNGERKFTEVTEEAGIYNSIIGYGLNAMAGDLNNDGWDDIYVSNDFHEEDYYYLNQCNGTFKEINKSAFAHESRFSMGSDIGDLNNDGWLDIMTLDMLPEDEKVLKESLSDDSYELYQYKQRSWRYHQQFSKNSLQLNVGGGYAFSDISLFAGVAATDWSWSPLIADFNNDGIKDIFVSNGILKRPNDLDFLKYASAKAATHTAENMRDFDRDKIEKMPSGKVANYIFEGSRDLKFKNRSSDWGFDAPSLSNGAAYADLDNDGDLDIIVNNINEPAVIYRNNATHKNAGHYLTVQLKGDSLNPFAFGSKACLQQEDGTQYAYVTATRGFESASSILLHFGLGADTRIKRLVITWPDGKTETIEKPGVDRRLVLSYHNAKNTSGGTWPVINKADILFEDITTTIGLPYTHVEDGFSDFNVQELMPHKVSTQGPKLAVADVNGDGLDDFYIGGARGQAGKLFVQNNGSGFTSTNESLFRNDMNCEDVNAVFFDAENDGDKDLYVVSGGNEFFEGAIPLYDRLYLNDGRGGFSKSTTLPKIATNKSVAVPADIDRDGDLDLFVGGRAVTNQYGKAPSSYLLLNDGMGKFSIAPPQQSPGFDSLGMVTDATWVDIDKNGWTDLVVVGEWMSITIYKNNKGSLVNITSSLNLNTTSGLWNVVKVADVNNDGWDDLLLGNLGENSKLHANEKYPLKLFTGDITCNGFFDQVLAVEKWGDYYSFLGKEELEKRMPAIMRKKYVEYASYAGKSLEDVFGENLKRTNCSNVHILSSVILLNNAKGGYHVSALPPAAQWSPVYSFVTGDFNSDGKTDILCAGNFTGVFPFEGFYDAGYGMVLTGMANNDFTELHPWQTGLFVKGEVRDVKLIKTKKGESLYAIARNNNSILFLKNIANNKR